MILIIIIIFISSLIGQAIRYLLYHGFSCSLGFVQSAGLGLFFAIGICVWWGRMRARRRRARTETQEEIRRKEIKELLKLKKSPWDYWTDRNTFIGWKPNKQPFYTHSKVRTLHTEIIGPTGCGKTESVILPWLYQDILQGNSVFILDGKGERDFYEKITAFTKQAGREKVFYYLNPSFPDISNTYTPLIDKDPNQLTDLIIAAFQFEKPGEAGYYSDIVKVYLNKLFKVLCNSGRPFNFKDILRIVEGESIAKFTDRANRDLVREFQAFTDQVKAKEIFDIRTKLQRVADNPLFNSYDPDITMDKVAHRNRIFLVQLNCGEFPKLAPELGKMILYDLQLQVAKRQNDPELKQNFFAVYMDEFQNFLYEGFAGFLQTARSGNVGVHISHQNRGDLTNIACPDPEGMRNKLEGNTRNKIIFGTDDPGTAQHYADMVGTVRTEKITEQIQHGLFFDFNPAGSTREIQEYICHPTLFKYDFKRHGIALFIDARGGKQLLRFPYYEIEKKIQIRGKGESRKW